MASSTGKERWGNFAATNIELMLVSNKILTAGFADRMCGKKCGMMKRVHDACNKTFVCHIGQRVRGSIDKQPLVIDSTTTRGWVTGVR